MNRNSTARKRERHGDSMVMETLEPRLLLSADPITAHLLDPSAMLDNPDTADDADATADALADLIGIDAEQSPLQEPQDLPAPLDLIGFLPGAQHDQSTTRELVIVDANTPDRDALVADLLAARAERQIDVYVLDAERDGIEQIGALLESYQDLHALHIVSHGADGMLQLGATRLDADTLGGYAEALRGWANALDADADLLLYGCDLAATEHGRALVANLASLTGADVAASVNVTGHASLGGDWVLEHQSGHIETEIALTETLQARWTHSLATIAVTTENDLADGGDTTSISTLLDTPGSDGISLREAVIAANNTGGADQILLGTDKYQLKLTGVGEDFSASGDLDIRDDLTIVGGDYLGTVIDGWGTDRIFHVHPGVAFTITDVTLEKGQITGSGAGVRMEAGSSVTIERALMIQNNAFGGGHGAAIFNDAGTLVLRDVQIENNSADSGDGGGLYNNGNAALERVTLNQNDAKSGGGLYNKAAGLTLDNVTISANNADIDGGGIWTDKAITATHLTLVSNTADKDIDLAGNGAGIWTDSGADVTLQNSILADNLLGTGAAENLHSNDSGAVTSLGGNVDDDGTAGLAQPSDTSFPGAVNLQLGALADNGGFTQTHDIGGGSVARNHGVGAPLGTDQRGVTRDASPDAGAYEISSAKIAPVISTGGSALFIENAAPVQIDPAAALADPDTANFNGGSLTVAFVTNGTPDDRLSIQNQSPGAGRVTTDISDNVFYNFGAGAVLVGSFSGGTNHLDPLIVTFNSSATREAVQAVMRAATFETVADVPSTATRTLSFTVDDGDAGLGNTDTADVQVMAANDAPVLDDSIAPGSSTNFVEGAGPVVIDPGMQVTDPDSPDFNGGVLTVQFSSGNDAGDILSVRDEGTGNAQVSVFGTTVRYNFGAGVVDIAILSGGTDATGPLVITFNVSATEAAVQAVARNVTYDNASAVPSEADRRVQFTLTDGDGGTSNTELVDVEFEAERVFWFSAKGSESPSDALGGTENWLSGDVVEFGAGASFDPTGLPANTTSGTFSNQFGFMGLNVADADPLNHFAEQADLRALHYVGIPTTLGGGADTFTVQPGDLIAAIDNADPIRLTSSNATSIDVTRQDIFVFSPDSPGDYSAGTFTLLLSNPFGKNIHAITLIEEQSGLGNGALNQLNPGDFLVAYSGPGDHNDVYKFTPTQVVTATNAGPLTKMLEGDTLGFSDQIQGLDLVDKNLKVGDTTIAQKQLLMSLDKTNTVGGNLLAVDPHDVFLLNITGTELSGGTAATATLFFDGSDVGLGDGTAAEQDNETIDGLTLARIGSVSTNIAPSTDIAASAYSVNENSTFDLIGQITVADADAGSGTIKVILAVDEGVLSVDPDTTGVAMLGSGTGSVSLAGTLTQLNNLFTGAGSASLGYNAVDAPSASATLTVTVDDQGNTGGPPRTAMDTATLNITAQNDAPELDNSDTLTLDDEVRNSVNPLGNTVAEILASAGGDPITDADAGALEGIAVTGVDNANGRWEYSTNGGVSWTSFALSGVSTTGADDSAAVLLADTSRIRFVPNAAYTGSAGDLSFRAWDRTSGSVGDAGVDVTANGTDTAFSTDEETASLTIIPGPVASHSVPGAQSTDEDTARIFSTGNANAITVSDSMGTDSLMRVEIAVSNGTLTLAGTAGISIASGADGSAAMSVVGLESAINTALDGLRFDPTPDYAGPANLSVTSTLFAGLQGRWTFDGSPAAQDQSPDGGNDGTLLGADQIVDPERGQVMEFDGNDSVRVNGTFGDPQTVTLAAWVKLEPGNQHDEVISLGNSVALRLDDFLGSGVKGFFYDGSTWQSTPSGQFIAGTGWHHVAYTFDGPNDKQILYIDGEVVASTSHSAAIDYTLGANTYLGRNGSAANTYLHGLMDDARVYDRALSTAEIAALIVGSESVSSNVAITVDAVNDEPSFSLGANQTVAEDSGPHSVASFASALPGGGADESGQTFSYNVSNDNPGLFAVAPSIDASGTLSYTLNANANGSATVTVSVSDSGGTAKGGDDTADDQTFTIIVDPVNDAPVNTVPGQQSIPVDGSVVFNAGTGTEISIADIDAGSGAIKITLSAGGGTLSLSTSAGLAFSSGTGTGDTSMTFTGTLAAVNAALDGLRFDAAPGFIGFAGITLNTNDQGNSPGPALTDLDKVSIAVGSPEQQLWLTFENDHSPTGNADIPAITGGDVVSFGNITDLEPGVTAGDFSYLFNLDAHVDDGNVQVRGVHQVGHDMTVGSNNIALLAGDVLFSTDGDETIDGIDYKKEDVLVFRPSVAGHYTNGSVFLLVDGTTLGLGNVMGISLVEYDTVVGDVTLSAGEFLLAHSGDGRDLLRLQPGNLGSGSTGALSILLDGSLVNIGADIDGVHLVQLDTTLGPTALSTGQILLSLKDNDGSVGDGSSPISTERHDVFVLDVSATEIGGGAGASAATANRLFEGLDEKLDDGDEDIWGVALAVKPTPADLNEAPTLSVETRAFINELHYDNTGTDSGEFVEVAALAGTDLSGWSLVFYNGFDGTVYRTEALSGVVADQGDGMGTVTVNLPVNGIQNAGSAADGIALVDAGGTVLEFISYEGMLTAVNGPAAGMNSTDIGVSENGTTPAGQSLQRGGAGVTFGWAAAAPETPGAANVAQDFAAVANALTEQVLEDGALVFNAANGNAITVADPDAGVVGDPLRLTLRVTQGVLTLGSTAGLSNLAGDGTATVSFEGTVAEVNAALEGLNYQPTSDYVGTDLLTIVADDQANSGPPGALTDTGQVLITVNPVNDEPSFTMAGNQTVAEDSGPHSVAGFASAAPGGGADESGQVFTYSVSNDNPGLFAVAPSIDASGTLSYTLNANANGSATVTVSVSDSGGTANGGDDTADDQTFSITVNAVNDEPSFTLAGNQTVAEDSGPHSVAGFASGAPGGGADESGQGFTYTLSNDNPGLFAVAPSIDASGTLSYALNANVSGSATVTVGLNDSGGTANGGDDTADDQSFTITVDAVNDPPDASIPLPSYPVTEGVPLDLTTLGFSVSDPDAGADIVQARLSVAEGTLTVTPGTTGVTVFGSGTGSVTIFGAISAINDVLAGNLGATARYDAATLSSASVTLALRIDDLGNNGGVVPNPKSDTATTTLNIAPANDPPSADIVQAGYLVNENTALVLHGTGLSVADPDAGGAAVRATLSVGEGRLLVDAGASGVSVLGSGSASVTLDGTIGAINTLLDGLSGASVRYAATDTPSASTALTLTVNDRGNTGGAPSGLSDSDTANLAVRAENDAPLADAGPSNHSITDTASSYALHGTGMLISDVDAGAAPVRVTLSVGEGSLTVSAGTTGVSVTASGSAAVTLDGSIDAINRLLRGELGASIGYNAIASPSAITALTLTVNDLGNSPSGALSGSDTSSLNISPPTPVIQPPPDPVPGPVPEPEPVPKPDNKAEPAAQPPSDEPVDAAVDTPDAAPSPAHSGGGEAETTSELFESIVETGQSGARGEAAPGAESKSQGTFDLLRTLLTRGIPDELLALDETTSRATPLSEAHQLLRELDNLREDLVAETRSEHRFVTTTLGVSTGLSIGYVVWLVRGGLLLSTVLSSMPAWRLVDPLPVLGAIDDEEESEDGDGEVHDFDGLEEMVDQNSQGLGHR